ncbi:MAG: methyl-accepting chemotaxis protein [Desulfobacterales bacterium]
MKSIKNKILIRFSFFSFLILLTIGIVISVKLDTGLSRQGEKLSGRLRDLMIRNLAAHHHMAGIAMDRMGKEAELAAKDFLLHHGTGSETVISDAAVFRELADFAVLYDPEGNCTAFRPGEKQGADAEKTREYFNSWEIRQGILELLKKDKEDGQLSPVITFARHDRAFIEALGLAEKYPSGNHFLSILSAVPVTKSSPAMCPEKGCLAIAGRILNQHVRPFQEIHAATGSAIALFAGTEAAVDAGFLRGENANLRLSPEQAARIAESSLPLPLSLEADGRSFHIIASALSSADGAYAGAVCAGISEEQSLGIEKEFLSEARAYRKNLVLWISGISLTALGIFVAVSLVIATEIERPINKLISGISDAASSLAAASDQVSTMGQHMAEGSSEQAAAADQASMSLSDMADAIKETSGLTHGAGELMNDNIKKSVKTVMLLVELTEQIATIEKDSDRIGNIIKSIDEIAFQTNLLALNAAVEAAHAGRAGAGFAVVADEVRNLAARSTVAAKNTQELLDTTIRRIAQSAGAVRDMNRDFEGIIKSSTIMGDKTAAITNASRNHADVLRQISDSVSGMNQGIQQNAANAQELASASEELNAQAEQLKEFVGTLLALTGGQKK